MKPSFTATALHVARSGSRVLMRDPQMIMSGCDGMVLSMLIKESPGRISVDLLNLERRVPRK
jgi:hypothetical protein